MMAQRYEKYSYLQTFQLFSFAILTILGLRYTSVFFFPNSGSIFR